MTASGADYGRRACGAVFMRVREVLQCNDRLYTSVPLLGIGDIGEGQPFTVTEEETGSSIG